MPIRNSLLQKPDPFIMKQVNVNNYIIEFLKECDVTTLKVISKVGPIDIISKKNGYNVYVKSKANQGKNSENDIVFKNDQLDNQLGDHVEQILRLYQKDEKNKIIVMGNPNIPRIKQRVNNIQKSLDKLDIVRFWVNQNGTIEIEGPKHLISIFEKTL